MLWQRTLFFEFQFQVMLSLLYRNTINFCKSIPCDLAKLVCLPTAPAATQRSHSSCWGLAFSVFFHLAQSGESLVRCTVLLKDQLLVLLAVLHASLPHRFSFLLLLLPVYLGLDFLVFCELIKTGPETTDLCGNSANYSR